MLSCVGHGMAKVLGIQLQDAERNRDEVTRGESVFLMQPSDTFVEEPPTVADWAKGLVPSRKGLANYVVSLFPFLNWIRHYNQSWLFGDIAAGV